MTQVFYRVVARYDEHDHWDIFEDNIQTMESAEDTLRFCEKTSQAPMEWVIQRVTQTVEDVTKTG